MTVAPSLLGQGESWQQLREAAAAGDRGLHHGLLIEGPRGAGKTLAAHELAADLLGSGRGSGDDARERVHSGNHPDLHLLEVPEDKVEIPVDAVRGLQSRLQRSPVEGGARVAIVDPADRLNEQGQNALLKTLEEPPERCFLILCTARPEALLDTVRSRLQRHRLLPLSEETLRDLLVVDGTDRERIAWILPRAEGSLGRARALADPQMMELDGMLAAYLAAPADAAGLASRCLEGISGRQDTEQRVEWVLRLCRHQLRQRLQSSLVGDQGSSYPELWTSCWQPSFDAVLRAEEDLGQHLGAGPLLTGLFLELADRNG